MNKMIINHLEKTFVTSDCATILKEMEVEHPAAKLVVLASQMQEVEVGDGSNSVVILSGELMNQAEELIRMGLHSSEIIAGYQKAAKKALEIMDEKDLTVSTVDEKALTSRDTLVTGVFAAIAAKQHGYENFLAPLIADACLTGTSGTTEQQRWAWWQFNRCHHTSD
jgi:T-complex protein 1 subunit theta